MLSIKTSIMLLFLVEQLFKVSSSQYCQKVMITVYEFVSLSYFYIN